MPVISFTRGRNNAVTINAWAIPKLRATPMLMRSAVVFIADMGHQPITEMEKYKING